MTHDEAVAALESLPEVRRVEVARINPGDVVVIEWPGRLSAEMVARMRQSLTMIWPNNKIVILDEGATLRVVATIRAISIDRVGVDGVEVGEALTEVRGKGGRAV